MSQSSTFRGVLKAGTAISLAVSFAAAFGAPAASAQDASAAPAEGTEIVVTGQRAQHRTRLNTLAPVDVISKDSLSALGNTELAQGLSRVAPSLNFPRPSAVDGTDTIRPASLRGLSPDQTLVLVNGKRQHASGLVNINGSAGRGSSAVDLNAIPESAIDRAEVLRDGASSQYGSDAIAGVINLHLREANHGGNVEASFGQYDTNIKAASSERKAHDGETTDINGWIGLPLGTDGFLTLSADAKKRKPTSRGDIDATVTPATVTSRYGDPEQSIVSVYANAGIPLNGDWKLYGNAGYTDNNSKSAAFFRHAYNTTGTLTALYPNGFLPIINAKSKDYSATGGVKGTLAGWASDISLSYGGNQLHYYTLNSNNASYGAASKTSFDDGKLEYDQAVFNADFSRAFETGLASPLTFAWGLEARHETYKISAGELQSYSLGPVTANQAGAQAFGGFQPSNVVDKSRDNVGVYVDAAVSFTEKLSVDVAARAENYSDFGGTLNAKLAARYDFTPNFAIRGAVESGFRAPSLQQQYFTSTASVVSGGVVVETGTFPSNSSVGRALGGADLNPEQSTSQSLGVVYHKGPFEVTLDGYRIRIDDRIVLSENLSGGAITPLLQPYGVTSARFFMNGITSTTTGADLVAAYRIPTDNYGRFNLSLAFNTNNTVINKLPVDNALSTVTPTPVLFARIRQYILTNAAPENKGSFAVDWQKGAWSVSGRATYYGDVIDPASLATGADDIHTGDKTLVDLSGSYRFGKGTRVTIGADNLFDVYPDKTPARLNSTTSLGNGTAALAFTRFSPFGFNGRYLYAKVSQSW